MRSSRSNSLTGTSQIVTDPFWPYTGHIPNKPIQLSFKMRKIESQMNAAIQANANWKNANTSVTTENGVSEVRLHGNLIAKVGDDFVTVFDGGWQSTTTKSRLNAIIDEFCNASTDGVFQRDFAWYVRDNKVTHDFVNGYTFCEYA